MKRYSRSESRRKEVSLTTPRRFFLIAKAGILVENGSLHAWEHSAAAPTAPFNPTLVLSACRLNSLHSKERPIRVQRD